MREQNRVYRFPIVRPIPARHPKPGGNPFLEKRAALTRTFRGDGHRTMNILIVEDHQDTRRVLSALLGRADHEVITASGVTEAVKLLENVRVNVLLSDLGLPDGDGLELVTKAKAIQPNIRAIALTARDSKKDQQLGQQAGFDHYLSKPFDFHELRTLLGMVRKAA